MNTSDLWIAFTIIVLAVVALLVFVLGKGRKANRLTPLAGLAFGFVLAGIVFGENRLFAYGLMAIGVLLAVVDMARRPKSM